MGFDFISFLQENLKEVFIFVVGAFAFFLVISASTGDATFMRYYAKDLGLTMESLRAAEGDVELSYNKFASDYAFEYDFSENLVRVGAIQEEGEPSWLWRRRYAAVELDEGAFSAPTLLHFERSGEKLLIGQTASFPSLCPPLPEPLEGLALKGVSSLEEAYPISTANPYLVRATITESEERSLALVAENALVAERARCALLKALAPTSYEVLPFEEALPKGFSMALIVTGNASQIEPALVDWLEGLS